MNILLGITGGIAAYKTATLVRLFVKNGHNVKVVMTEMSKKFITPLTLATLSKNPILTEFFSPENGEWNSHVNLGLWADAYVIAPATANSIAKMANGIADNLLLTTYLSARCPVFFAPTMDLDMFQHNATQINIIKLKKLGHIEISPDSGELASGLVGKGRMVEPEVIYSRVSKFFDKKKIFAGKNVLITAGPTYEHIDPVRFIGNHSSGKMGYAIANEFAQLGANVFLISGKTNQKVEHKNITRIDVVSADDMYKEATELFLKTDIAVLAAAVADYTPVNYSDVKIKKSNSKFILELKKTPDIAYELGKLKNKNQFIVGFALETNDELQNAKNKLKNKNFDFIVLNSLNDKGAGFNADTNKIYIIKKDLSVSEYFLKSKINVAKDIVAEIRKELDLY